MSRNSETGVKTVIKGFGALFSILLLAALLTACSSDPSTSNILTASTVVNRTMVIRSGTEPGKTDWPQFSPADITIPAGATVKLTIISYDNGTAPLPTGSPFGHVWGGDSTFGLVQGGTELSDGKPLTELPNSEVSHTFTVPGLLINVVIPAVPNGATTTTVVYTFRVLKRGTYEWLCAAPCGSGSMGMGGAMQTFGWMRGLVKVV